MKNQGVQIRNLLIAGATVVIVVGLYGATSSDLSRVTPAKLALTAVPYEEARANGKPTLLEFYADWCETCKQMAPTLAKLEQRYRGKVNLVMLNVDNPKWSPELDRYQVNGIPHYVFLSTKGAIAGNVIGEQSEDLFDANLQALSTSKTLPYARPTPGQISTFQAPAQQLQPRDHSS